MHGYHGHQQADWSIRQLDAAALKGPVTISDVIFAELSVRFATIEVLEVVLHDAGVAMEPMPRPALFLAGNAFQRYRTAGRGTAGDRPPLCAIRRARHLLRWHCDPTPGAAFRLDRHRRHVAPTTPKAGSPYLAMCGACPAPSRLTLSRINPCSILFDNFDRKFFG
jgi:hypothetical protein